jgi:hypothetical protein
MKALHRLIRTGLLCAGALALHAADAMPPASPASMGRAHPGPPRKPEAVICPRAVIDSPDGTKVLRQDFATVFSDPIQWPETFRMTNAVKFYVTALAPVFGLDLARFVKMASDGGFRAEFETGGLRPENAADFNDRTGEKQALKELIHLRRWAEAGGKVDRITTDHAIMHQLAMNHRDKNYFNHKTVKLPPGKEHLRFDRTALLEELMDYFLTIKAEFPDAKLGVIESLGYFHVTGESGMDYPTTDKRLPRWDFTEFLDALLTTASRSGVKIDGFDIDFSHSGSAFDTRRNKGRQLDVGRVAAAVQACRKRGLEVGIIFNDDGGTGPDFRVSKSMTDPGRNRISADNLHAFQMALERNQVLPDRIIIQSWSDYPDLTGPESKPGTFFHTAAKLLNAPP